MFEVLWKRSARGQLADIWVNASNRNAITAAVDSIDRALRSDPDEQGESREDQERVVVVPPLVVDFRVIEEDRRVEILAVRQLRQRPQKGRQPTDLRACRHTPFLRSGFRV
jgi:plasmid stabilization system protein ParE